MSTRRCVVSFAAALAAWRLAAAQSPPATPRSARFGLLTVLPPTAPEVVSYFRVFYGELERRGWVPGRNLEIVVRATEGRNDTAPALARQLVEQRVDVIMANRDLLIQAALQATRTIPIVTTNAVYPVELKLVESLARPGGNVTGVASQTAETTAKNFELLREWLPQINKVAVLWNPSTPSSALAFKDQQAYAGRLGLELHSLPAHGPDDIDAALHTALRAGVQALTPHPNPAWWRRIPAAWGIEHKIVIIAPVHLGYLFDYGPDWDEVMDIAAGYIDRILRGESPATMPMQQPTRFRLALNLKTARALGLSVPRELLLRAHEVIE